MPAQSKAVNKNVVFRVYGAELARLKSAVKQITDTNGLTPEIYGADEEYLIDVNVTCDGEAAGEMLLQKAADILEGELGEDLYGRGEHTLAHVAAAALMLKEAQLVCASEELGNALEIEFDTTKRGKQVFDYGEMTYNSKKGRNIEPSVKVINKYGEESLQGAAECAFAAMRKAKAKLGCAITPQDADGRCWVAVTFAGNVYARQLQQAANMRTAALAVLDIVRRVSAKIELNDGTRKFKKSRIDVNKKDKKRGSVVLTIVILLIFCVTIALVVMYFNDTYSIAGANSLENSNVSFSTTELAK